MNNPKRIDSEAINEERNDLVDAIIECQLEGNQFLDFYTIPDF